MRSQPAVYGNDINNSLFLSHRSGHFDISASVNNGFNSFFQTAVEKAQSREIKDNSKIKDNIDREEAVLDNMKSNGSSIKELNIIADSEKKGSVKHNVLIKNRNGEVSRENKAVNSGNEKNKKSSQPKDNKSDNEKTEGSVEKTPESSNKPLKMKNKVDLVNPDSYTSEDELFIDQSVNQAVGAIMVSLPNNDYYEQSAKLNDNLTVDEGLTAGSLDLRFVDETEEFSGSGNVISFIEKNIMGKFAPQNSSGSISSDYNYKEGEINLEGVDTLPLDNFEIVDADIEDFNNQLNIIDAVDVENDGLPDVNANGDLAVENLFNQSASEFSSSVKDFIKHDDFTTDLNSDLNIEGYTLNQSDNENHTDFLNQGFNSETDSFSSLNFEGANSISTEIDNTPETDSFNDILNIQVKADSVTGLDGKAQNRQNISNYFGFAKPDQTNILFEKELLSHIQSKIQTKNIGDITRSEMKFSLKPEHLGELSIKIVMDNNILKAKIDVDNNEVKQVLESNVSNLEKSLAEQGIKVEKVEVSLKHDGGDKKFYDEGKADKGYGNRDNNNLSKNNGNESDSSKNSNGDKNRLVKHKHPVYSLHSGNLDYLV